MNILSDSSLLGVFVFPRGLGGILGSLISVFSRQVSMSQKTTVAIVIQMI